MKSRGTRSIVVVIASLALALGLGACGGDATETTDTSDPAAITAPTPTGTSASAAQTLIATPSTTSDCAEPETLEITALLKELQSCKPDLSPFTKDAIRLYLEL